MKSALLVIGLVLLTAIAIWFSRNRTRQALPPKPRTVEDVLAAIGPQVDDRLRTDFDRAGVAYPPPRLVWLALKQERRMELYAGTNDGSFRLIRSYPILGASGGPGPKLREGDSQVPEGFYRIELLNPNSRYHLSLRVNYPNNEDRASAVADGRDLQNLGGDIMIHGSNLSIGCLAMGDPAAEDLFVLAARTGLDHIELIICPQDFRKTAPAESTDLNQRLAEFVKKF